MLESRLMPGRSPGARSVPATGSKYGSPAQAEVRRQKRVRRVAVMGVCATSSPTLRAGSLESMAAFGTEDPSCSFDESLKRSPSRIVTLVLRTNQKEIS